MGRRYSSIDGAEDPGDSDGFVTGFISPTVVKPRVLLDNNGNIFERSKPQYESMASGGFLVATEFGIANDGTGDQAMAINNLLIGAGGTPVFFPAGIYQVKSTVHVPVGSIIVGEGWSQVSISSLVMFLTSCPGVDTYILDYGYWILLRRCRQPPSHGSVSLPDI
jgi:hypothetical protein